MKTGSMSKGLDARSFFLLLIGLLILTNLAVLLDIAILRQALGFIFLTFLPGLLMVFILKLGKLGWLEKIVLSVGLSIAFAMFLGLLVNSLCLALGYTKPLSTLTLLIAFSLASVVLAIIAYIRNKGVTFSLNLGLTTSEKAFLIVPSLFPLMSVMGTRVLNLTGNNMLLMALLFVIPAYVIFVSFFNRKVPEKVYPMTIFLVSISLLLMFSLRGNHVMGGDTHEEYYLFQMTLSNQYWGITRIAGLANLDACLNISLLPSIYQSFLKIDPEYLFKILYTLTGSILPLVVYALTRKYVGSFYAFLASVLLMSQFQFLWTPGYARDNTAILFFALAIMVWFHDNLGGFAKRALFIIFVISILVSHYSISYIVFFLLLFTWIGMKILLKIIPGKKALLTRSSSPPHEGPVEHDTSSAEVPPEELPRSRVNTKMTISATLVALFFAMLFLWYYQVLTTPFTSGVVVIRETFANLGRMFIMEARGKAAQIVFGRVAFVGIPKWIELVFNWLIVLFMGIGVLTMIVRFRRMVHLPGSGHKGSEFLSRRVEADYFVLSLAVCVILGLSFLLPTISIAYGVTRAYFPMITILATFFILGGIMVSRWLRLKPYWLMLVVLVPFFMCTTGTMYQAFGIPRAPTLNSQGYLYDTEFVHDQDSYAAGWIKEHGDTRTGIYTDGPGQNRLISQGNFPPAQPQFLGKYLEVRESPEPGYIYLRYQSVIKGELAIGGGICDIEQHPYLLSEKSKIYGNGGSEVYR